MFCSKIDPQPRVLSRIQTLETHVKKLEETKEENETELQLREGLEKDLKMTGTDYNVANMMFFIPYILLEVPANTILMKFKQPSLWIGFIVTAWGIVMTCTGFVKNWTGLLICRVLLGVFEYVHAS